MLRFILPVEVEKKLQKIVHTPHLEFPEKHEQEFAKFIY